MKKSHARKKKRKTKAAKLGTGRLLNEAQLIKAIIQLLEACGWYPIRTHRPGQFATQKGVSDLIAIPPAQYQGKNGSVIIMMPGIVAFIEVKGPRAKLKPEQSAFLAEMESRGHIAFVAEDIETVVEKLGLEVLL